MNENTNLIDEHNEGLTPIEELSPFKRIVLSLGTLPSAFYNTMTYYESLVYFYEYLKNEVIPTVNNNGEAVEELQTKYIELKSYVDNYFDNLDVQEEINAKLDAMADDGTLTNLIKDYVDPIYQAYEESINETVSNIDDKVEDLDTDMATFKDIIEGQVQDIDYKVTIATGGSPKGVYATVSDLTTADPDHDYIYVVTADGNWYYYNTSTSSWTSGGTYQSTEILDDSITYNKTNFLKLGNQLFNKNTVTTGKYVSYTNGNIYNDQNSAVSDYIIVKGLTYVYTNYNNQCAFYDENKTFISGFNGYMNSVPSNAYYIRITVPNSASALGKCMLNSGTTGMPYEDYKYELQYLNIDKNQINFETNKIDKNETDFIIESHNLIDYNNIIEGKFISYNNGVEASNSNFIASNFIKINPTESYITLSPYSSNTGYQGAFYNKNKQYISGIYNNATTAIPESAYYVRISMPISLIDKASMYYGNTTDLLYEPFNNYLYKANNKIIYVGPHRTITKLIDGIKEASKYFGATIYIDEGVYDLVSEYGSSYLNNNNERGPVLCNQMHLIFASNAFVTFNYTGSNSYIHQNFSPFNSGLYGFTLENLNLTSSNCRYCVHDERGGSTESYINKYINCKMSLDNSQNPDWSNPQNIGAGLGEQGYIVVDGCHFNNWCTWHNNNNTGYLNSCSKVIIRNNYFDNGFIYATDDTKTAFTNASLFYVYNNCKKGNIVTTEGNTNIVVKEWNNIQHD